MSRESGDYSPIVVISDDEELGGLIALNLRRRRFLVEQTDFELAASPHWSPANGRPAAVVVEVEKANTDPLEFLRAARPRPWLNGVPVVLAADKSAAVVAQLRDDTPMLSTTIDDVRAIVAAVLCLVDARNHAVQSASTVLSGNEH